MVSKDRLEKLKKLSGVTSTQPLYETLDGKEFTIADIVQGKIKPPKKKRKTEGKREVIEIAGANIYGR